MAGTVITDLAWFVGVTSPYYNSNCDQTIDWSGSPALDSITFIQGTGALSAKVSKTTFTSVFSLKDPTNLTDKVIYIWAMCSGKMDTKANGGFRIRIEDTSANWGEWYMAGANTWAGGWQPWAVHTSIAYSAKSATPPTLSAINKVGIVFTTTGSASAINSWWDALRYGTYIGVKSGTEGSPATLQDIMDAENDVNNKYGVLSEYEGLFIVQGKLLLGSATGGEGTYFKDTSERVLIFPDKPFPADFYEIKLQGNGTASTKIFFGTKVGESGVSGVTIRAASASSPFKVTASDTLVTEYGFYGCIFYQAGTITLQPYSIVKEFLGCTVSKSAEMLPGTGIVKNCFFTSAVDRAIRIVAISPDKNVTNCTFINCPRATHIPNAGTYEFDGLNFSGNSRDIDNSSGLTVTVNSSNSANPPSTYVNSIVDEQLAYNNVQNLFLGDVIRSAQRKTISSKQIARAGYSFRKVGSPTGDIVFRVRKIDDTILQEVVWGNVSVLDTAFAWRYAWFTNPPTINEEIRATIEFAGENLLNSIIVRYQATDVKASEYRSDWTSSWTDYTTQDLTYGLVLHDPSVTTNIINTVYLTVDVEDENGDPVIGAAVYVEKASNQTVLMNELTVLTGGKGRAQESYNYSPPPFTINVRVRKSSSGGTRYVPMSTIGEVGADGYSLNVILIADTNIG